MNRTTLEIADAQGQHGLRVLHVVASLSPQWGGPPSVVGNLTRALHDRGVGTTVFAAVGKRVGTPTEATLKHADVQCFPTRWLAIGWTGYAPTMASSLRKAVAGHDLVHIHELWHYPHYAAYRAAQAVGRPYIVTVHGGMDPWALGHKRLKKRLFMALFERRILEQAAALQALTEEEADQIRAEGVPTPIMVIPNGIDLREYANLPPKQAFINRFPELRGKRIMLYLGRIHRKKGLDLLVESFARLAHEHVDLRLVIAGPDEDGYGRRIESMLAARQLLSKTTFTGVLTREDKLAAYAASDLFVLPSYSEGFSIAVLEAMASGLPVVISSACYFPEVARAGAGLVVEPRTSELHHALASLLQEPPEQLRAMGHRGRKLIAERYSWESVAKQMDDVYRTIVERRAESALRNSS